MKTAIVGMGNVGAATAHALVAAGLAGDLVLVSRDARKAEGEASDLQHAAALLPHVASVRGGDEQLLDGAELLVLTYSFPLQAPDRRSLAESNGRLFRETIPRYLARCPGAVVIVVSNPVDALTWLTIELADLPPERVIGAGTIIDSARLRALLSEHYRIHPDDLRVYVLGEHGDHQFPSVSLASTGGVRLNEVDVVRRAFEQSKESGLNVFRKKGYTNFAVAQAVTMVARCVALDERRTLPVSTLVDGYLGVEGVCLSLPCVVGRGGVQRVLYPHLNDEEAAAFRASADVVRQTIGQLG